MTPEEQQDANYKAQRKQTFEKNKIEARRIALEHADRMGGRVFNGSMPADADSILADANKYYAWLTKDIPNE
jgi:hypothetical protein